MKVNVQEISGGKLDSFIVSNARMFRFSKLLKPGMKVIMTANPESPQRVKEIMGMARLVKSTTGNKLRLDSVNLLKFTTKFGIAEDLLDANKYLNEFDLVINFDDELNNKFLAKLNRNELQGKTIYMGGNSIKLGTFGKTIMESLDLSYDSI